MTAWIEDWGAYHESRAEITAAVEKALDGEMSEQEVRDTVEAAFAARSGVVPIDKESGAS